MKKIEELINCLATVLVHYREKQCGVVAGGAKALVISLLSEKNYDIQFKALNAEATKNYDRCKNLLQHLLDCIIYLKHVDAQQSFSSNEFQYHKNNITLLLSGLNQLLQIKQKESHVVVTPQKKAPNNDFIFEKITLSGCRIPGNFSGYSMCFSGQLTIDDLFDQIIPKAKMNLKGFEQFAEEALKEHQQPIVLAAMDQTIKLAQAEKENEGQKDKITALTAEIEIAKKLEETLKAKLEEVTAKGAKKENEGEKDKITALTAEIEKSKKIEETLKAKLDEVTAKAAKVEAELSEQIKKTSAVGGNKAIQHNAPHLIGYPQVFFGMNYAEVMKRFDKTHASATALTNK